MTLLRLATLTIFISSALCADPLDYLSLVPSWAKSRTCGVYGDECNTPESCCTKLTCFQGRCLQAQCNYIVGVSCGPSFGDCCWHMGLNCTSAGSRGTCNQITLS